MMHLHGSGKFKKDGPIWPGVLVLTITIMMVIGAFIRIGWLALAPFGFAAFLLFTALWLMRVSDRRD
ncbi:MAG: hypothetical protein BroJett018_21510 [Chloroflexota bacterium]|nr:hypothetical protein [Chloroflexota bacterium]GIK64357.1 MAG: hypothetical protein BroJett018_21510 [Chloroflexota bacterium]